MRLFKKSLIFLLVVSLLVISLFFIHQQSFNDDLTSSEKSYLTDTSGFKIEKVAYSKVYSVRNDGLLKKLSLSETRNLLLILLDSANYRWGEIGTPIFDREILYFDSAGNNIGMTRLSYDGQTYTYPRDENQTKFGLLKIEMHNINVLIEQPSSN